MRLSTLTTAIRSIACFLGIWAGGGTSGASAEDLSIPINQITTRDGAHRYSVWIQVGDRMVEALLDTGSTGLRVLPTVVPGDLLGLPTDAVFGAGLQMGGLMITRDVGIGTMHASVPIEVIDHVGCLRDHPNCSMNGRTADTFLIGGDGTTAQGYSAILGIGFTSRSGDLPNPLQKLGANQWIVDLPRPFEAEPGHLLIDPTATSSKDFTMLSRQKGADFFSCLHGPKADDVICGPTTLDTGAPNLLVQSLDVRAPSAWDDASKGSLHIKSKTGAIVMTFDVGSPHGPKTVLVNPDDPASPSPFTILAGPFAFFQYDALYDAEKEQIGLKQRPAAISPFAPTQTAAQ